MPDKKTDTPLIKPAPSTAPTQPAQQPKQPVVNPNTQRPEPNEHPAPAIKSYPPPDKPKPR